MLDRSLLEFLRFSTFFPQEKALQCKEKEIINSSKDISGAEKPYSLNCIFQGKLKCFPRENDFPPSHAKILGGESIFGDF